MLGGLQRPLKRWIASPRGTLGRSDEALSARNSAVAEEAGSRHAWIPLSDPSDAVFCCREFGQFTAPGMQRDQSFTISRKHDALFAQFPG